MYMGVVLLWVYSELLRFNELLGFFSLELLYCQYEKLGYFCLGFIRLYKFVALFLHNFEVLGCTKCCIYTRY